MREFRVGDFVKVRRPEDTEAGAMWLASMDSLDGAILEITGIDGDGFFEQGFLPGYVLDASWLTHSLPDPINHPDHYAGSNGIECIDAMRATLTPEEFRGYCKGAAFKYIWRERQKGGNESLAKAVWYMNEAQK